MATAPLSFEETSFVCNRESGTERESPKSLSSKPRRLVVSPSPASLLSSTLSTSKYETPLKPRLRPLAAPSLVSPLEYLPIPLNLSNQTTAIHSAFLISSPWSDTCDASPSIDELTLSSLSLMSPTGNLLSLESDLHVGSPLNMTAEDIPLRTPFHPSSPIGSPSSEERLSFEDLAAFPIFDAKTGPTSNHFASISPSSPALLRPKLHRETTAVSLHSTVNEYRLSPSLPKRTMISSWRKSSSKRPSEKRCLFAIPESRASSTPSSPFTTIALRDPQSISRPPLNLHKRSTISTDFDLQEDDPPSTSNTNNDVVSPPPTSDCAETLSPCPYNSNDAGKHKLRPTMIPGFIQNLPRFNLPSTPSAASPVVISPSTPSRVSTPLKSPILIRRKEDSGSKWRSDSSSYFSRPIKA